LADNTAWCKEKHIRFRKHLVNWRKSSLAAQWKNEANETTIMIGIKETSYSNQEQATLTCALKADWFLR